MSSGYTQYASVLHDAFGQRHLGRFRGLLSPANIAASGKKAARSHAASQLSNSLTQDDSFSYQHATVSSLSRSPNHGGDIGPLSKDEANARDRLGRTVLHLVASLEDQDEAHDYISALLSSPLVNVNLQDKESGWTALHRALYGGNVITARRLLQHTDISTDIRDSEGMTAFDVLNSTILGTNPADVIPDAPTDENDVARRELITWGSNRNLVLGQQGGSDRTFPERVALSRNAAFEAVNIHKVVMEKLHAGVMTSESTRNLRLCGASSSSGRLGHQSQLPQYEYEPIRDFSHAKVTDFALGQDHTVLCTDKGDVWTFGLNAFSVLGHPADMLPAKSANAEAAVQATPKRLVGSLKKEFVIGVAASRYHSCCYTADSLYTWGKNNGQLGYPSGPTPVQTVPRKVTHVTQAVQQLAATEVATACLVEGGEVYVLYRDAYFRITFPSTRFPASVQVYRPPSIALRAHVTKIAGSGTTFLALSDMGDVFSWQLDNPALEATSVVPNSGREVKPQRIWEDRKTYTAAKDCCIAGDIVTISTRSGHVFVRARKKELATIKGFELKGPTASQLSQNKKGLFKFSRVSNLQRVVGVAVSSSGGFAAIRSDAPLKQITEVGESLSASLARLLPHYARLAWLLDDKREAQPYHLDTTEGDDEDDESLDTDKANIDRLCDIFLRWNKDWSIPAHGTDLLLVAGITGTKIPVHSTVLAARSTQVRAALDGEIVQGLLLSKKGARTLLLGGCSLFSTMILLHYLYADEVLAIWDARLFNYARKCFPSLRLKVMDIKQELQHAASILNLPSLKDALDVYGRCDLTKTLSQDLSRLLSSGGSSDMRLRTKDAVLLAHSAVLSARCPFFSAFLADPEWYVLRLEQNASTSDWNVEIDLSHLDADIMRLVLRYIYSDTGEDLIIDSDYPTRDAKIEYCTKLLAAANELLLDGLKAVCSRLIRPLVNLRTVCAVLSDAVFYEALELAECCMQYICCNFETMLEQQLLNDLDAHVLQRLTDFCRKRQLDRVPKTVRSKSKLAQLLVDNAEWIKDVQTDIPRATGGYRRFIKARGTHAAAFSPKLSPTVYSTSLTYPDTYLSSSPNADFSLSPPGSARLRDRPPSPMAIVSSPATSPLLAASAADDSIPFDMDDLSISEPAFMSTDMPIPMLSLAKRPWQRQSMISSQPQSFRAIMEQTTLPPQQRTSAGQSASQLRPLAVPAETHAYTPTKTSQRERKRLQNSAIESPEGTAEALPVAATPAWRTAAASSPWKAPSIARNELSLQAIQDAERSNARLPQPSIAPTRPPVASTNNSLEPRMFASGKQADLASTVRPDMTSAIGAQVITPTRIHANRSTSGGTGRGIHSWANYSSTVSVAPAASPTASSAGQAFSTIQDAQATEREALKSRREPRSLAEIQEEEASQRQEAEFLTWFEEESKRTRTELGIDSKAQSQRLPKSRGKLKNNPHAQPQHSRGRGHVSQRDAVASHSNGNTAGRGRSAALNPDAPAFTIPGT